MASKLDVWTKFKNECIHAKEFEDKELQMQWCCTLCNGWCYYSKYCECSRKVKLQGELFQEEQ